MVLRYCKCVAVVLSLICGLSACTNVVSHKSVSSRASKTSSVSSSESDANTSLGTLTVNSAQSTNTDKYINMPISSFDLGADYNDVILSSKSASPTYAGTTWYLGEDTGSSSVLHGVKIPNVPNVSLSAVASDSIFLYTQTYTDTDNRVKTRDVYGQPSQMAVSAGAKQLILSFGYTDIPSNSDAAAAMYKTLIDNIRVHTGSSLGVIVQSVMPVAQSVAGASSIQQNINNTNVRLAQMCRAEGVKFLFTSRDCRDSAGYLNSSFENENALYQKWVDYSSNHPL